MDRRLLTILLCSTDRLAIDADQLFTVYALKRVNPAPKAFLERCRFHICKKAIEGVVGGNAILQCQKGAQPGLPDSTEFLDFIPVISTAKHRGKRNGDNIKHIALFPAVQNFAVSN